MNDLIVLPPNTQTPLEVIKAIGNFLKSFQPYEVRSGTKLNLYFDEKSSAYYVTCHFEGQLIVQFSDIEASLNSDDEDGNL